MNQCEGSRTNSMEILDSFFRDAAQNFLQNADFEKFFVNAIAEAIYDLNNQSTVLCFNRSQEFSWKVNSESALETKTINIDVPDGLIRHEILIFLLNYFFESITDYSNLSNQNLYMTWLSLLNMVNDRRYTPVCLNIMHRFILADLGDGELLLFLLDVLFALQEFLFSKPDEKEFHTDLQGSISSCLYTISNLFKEMKPLHIFTEINLEMYCHFIIRCARLLILNQEIKVEIVPCLKKFFVDGLFVAKENVDCSEMKSSIPEMVLVTKNFVKYLVECKTRTSGYLSACCLFLSAALPHEEMYEFMQEMNKIDAGDETITQYESLDLSPFESLPFLHYWTMIIKLSISCTSFSMDNEFSMKCYFQLLLHAIIYPPLIQLVKKLNYDIAKTEKILPQELYLKRALMIWKSITCEFLLYLKLKFQNITSNEDRNLLVDNLLDLFNFYPNILNPVERCGKFLHLTITQIVPSLIWYRKEKDTALFMFNRLCTILQKEPSAIICDSFPNILSLLIRSTEEYNSLTTKLTRRIIHFAKHKPSYFYVKKRFSCVVVLLKYLSVNTDICLKELQGMNMIFQSTAEPFNMTHFVKDFYLGILLELRKSLNPTDYFHFYHREEILRSLCLLMEILDSELLNETAGKMLNVLRNIANLGDLTIDAWLTFMSTLGLEVLQEMSHQIFVALIPFLKNPSASRLFTFFFDKIGNDCNKTNELITYVQLVLNDEDTILLDKHLLRSSILESPERTLKACITLLVEEGNELQSIVLSKMISLLDRNLNLDDVLVSNMINTLLFALQKSNSDHVRSMIGLCFGRIGAIEPGRLGLSQNNQDRRSSIINLSQENVLKNILEIAARLHCESTDVNVADMIAYCIQCFVKMVQEKYSVIYESLFHNLKSEIKREIGPLRNTSFNCDSPLPILIDERPIALSSHVSDYNNWAYQFFGNCLKNESCDSEYVIFKTVLEFARVGCDCFAEIFKFIFKYYILKLLCDRNEISLSMCAEEMIAVFTKAIESDGNHWAHLATHTIFLALEFLEKVYVQQTDIDIKMSDTNNKKLGDEQTQLLFGDHRSEIILLFEKFLKSIFEKRLADNRLLISVAVAQKLNFPCRALRWLEQYGFEIEASNNRAYFNELENIYKNLEDSDGVFGAFKQIQKNWIPNVQERIQVLESAGDFHEALHLYQKLPDKKESSILLSKCLLLLNEPQLALGFSSKVATLMKDGDTLKQKLKDYQIEATWRLGDWTELEKLLNTSKNSNEASSIPIVTTWEANLASILSGIKHQNEDEVELRINKARELNMSLVQAMALENSDVYSQAYKYILRLHILYEVEQVYQYLKIGSNLSDTGFTDVLESWKIRNDFVKQAQSVLEPIYIVRRDLLQMQGSSNNYQTGQYYLDSCKLARQSGHLHLIESYLLEARRLCGDTIEIDIEESRFYFQKNNLTQAISILNNAIEKKFPVFREAMVKKSSLRQALETKEAFLNSELLLTEYHQKAGDKSLKDIKSTFEFLNKLEIRTEHFYYSYALFLENYMECFKDKITVNDVIQLFGMYRNTLLQGSQHLYHAMPRMITLWLDYTEKPIEERRKAERDELMKNNPLFSDAFTPGIIGTSRRRRSDTVNSPFDNKELDDIYQLKNVVDACFKVVDKYYFYTAFSQLISRIDHKDAYSYQSLKIILSELILEFPHQTLWQSLLIINSESPKSKERKRRFNEIFTISSSKNKKLAFYYGTYKAFSDVLMRAAEDNKSPDDANPKKKVSEQWPFLTHFFKGIYIDRNNRQNNIGRYEIIIPLASNLEKNGLRPIAISSQAAVQKGTTFNEVYITGVDELYMEFKSLERPKKITLKCSDGKQYPILIKGGDELRKDARVMQFNRLMNTLLLQNSESRTRQLRIRTYSVIPLKETGGIIEWLPDLTTLRNPINRINKWKNLDISAGSWSPKNSDKKRMDAFAALCASLPPVLGTYLRRAYPDPISWYCVKKSFTYTAAAMSMVGFILGLGDRHLENILMDEKTGEIVHVDMNILFNRGEFLEIPELIPFRLTENFIDAMGPTGIEGPFRIACEIVMKIMREEKEMLSSNLNVFVHDPLLEFNAVERRNQQERLKQKNTTYEKESAHEGHKCIELIRARLSGHIATKRFHPLEIGDQGLSVEGQVERLIELATNRVALSKMFTGWAPYL